MTKSHHRHHHHRHHQRADLTRVEKRTVILKRALILLVFLCIVILGFFIGGKILDKYAPQTDEPELSVEPGLIKIDGISYRRRTEVKTYLLIGEDSTGMKNDPTHESANGQSDFIQLLIVDKPGQTFYRVPINRDTICDVRSLDEDGTVIATTPVQIAFAHAKGDGREISCENTAWSVSNLLYGAEIDKYASFNLETIKVLNHELGGVTVTILDDLKSDDFKVGDTVTLTDDQAVLFVRGRMGVADGTNVNRMSRQNQYLTALSPILKQKIEEDEAFAANLYKTLSDYMITDVSLGDISRLAKFYETGKDGGTYNISGESNVDKRGFNAFYPNEEDLKNIVTSLLYMPADE